MTQPIAMPAARALSETREAPAWYGKLCSIGDFVHRRLPADLLAPCDEWLSNAMRSGAQQLGPSWLAIYLRAPLLRFAWAPGVLDHRWWFGLLMPSCDDVGRYFPLLIVHPRQRAPADRIAFDHLELWYEHVGKAALRTLEAREDAVAGLEAALHDAPPWPAPATAAAWADPPDAHGQRLRLRTGATLTQWLHVLGLQACSAALAGCSLWWPVRRDGDQGTVEIVHGLPQGAVFLTLLQDAPA